MKKTVASFLFLLIVRTAIGQGMAVTNAVLLYENGEAAKAKEQIDKASVHEKTGIAAKTWYYKGLIYMDLADSAKAKEAYLNDGLKIAADAFEKVKQYDKPNGQYIKLSQEKAYPLWASLLNKGYSIKDENPDQAYEYYELAQKLSPDSVAAYEYAIDLAFKKENYEKLKKYYTRIIDLTNNPAWYSNLSWIYQNIDKSNEKALEIVQKGRQKYPSNGKLMEEEINIYIGLGKLDEAQVKMEQAIQGDQKNPLLYFNLGVIYAKKGNEPKALEFYNKALSLDTNNFDTNYNIGALYYNKGADLINITNKMELAEYQKTGKKKEEQGLAFMNQGLPYLEKAYAINSKDAGLKKILKDIYRRSKMEAKLKSLQ